MPAKKRSSYNEKRRVLRKLERLYKTDPEFRAQVDAIVDRDIQAIHDKVYADNPLLLIQRDRIREGSS